MELKGLVERHPVVYFLSSIITACSLTAGAVIFVANAQREQLEAEHRQELRSLEQTHQIEQTSAQRELRSLKQDHKMELARNDLRLVSLERRIGAQTDVFDVEKLRVTRWDAMHNLPQSKFHARWGFFARPGDPERGWVQGETTEVELASYVAKQPLGELLPARQREAMTAFPVMLWRNTQTHEVRSGETDLRVFRYILVQRIDPDAVPRLVASSLNLPAPGGEAAVRQASHAQGGGVSQHSVSEPLLGFDATGLLLSSQLVLETFSDVADESSSVVVESLQKKNGVVYARILTVLDDVVVDGEDHEVYYLSREFILLSTDDDLYFIKTLVPTADLQAASDPWINAWYADFGVLVAQ